MSGGSIIHLGGSVSVANPILDAGQAVGYSVGAGASYATEWSGGQIIDLGGLPGRLIEFEP